MTQIAPVSQRVYFAAGNYGTSLPGPNVLIAVPYKVVSPFRPDGIGITVTTAGAGTDAGCRLGVYRDAGGVPGDLVIDSGLITGLASTGAKTTLFASSVPYRLDQGWWWLVSFFGAMGTTQPTVASLSAGAQPTANDYGVVDFTALPSAAAGIPNARNAALTFAGNVLPASFPASSVLLNTAVPLVGLRAA